MGRAIEMVDVSVVRNGKYILDHVSLDVANDENIAIIGPNGSGKTTLMKLLRGEVLPFSDESGKTIFRLFGKDRWSLFELRDRIGMVSMDLQTCFSDDSRIRDVIMSGFFSSMDVYRNHDVTDEMRDIVARIGEEMGLGDKMDREIGKISLGEMRRVLISRALVNGPEMLVLDEPMTGLDVVMTSSFRNMFDSLIERNVNIIMITHELEDIPKKVERVVMIKDGRIFMDGPKCSVLTSNNVSRLFDSDISVIEENGSYRMKVR